MINKIYKKINPSQAVDKVPSTPVFTLCSLVSLKASALVDTINLQGVLADTVCSLSVFLCSVHV